MPERRLYHSNVHTLCTVSHDVTVFETGCRVVLTDHGSFVLINVYVPNAGPSPERPRAAYKYKFLEALKTKAVSLQDAGRQVIASTCSAMTASSSTEHAAACVDF